MLRRCLFAAFALALFAPAAFADCSNLYASTLGSTGSGNGQFNNPQRCTVDHAGNLYVVDTGNNRVQKFDHTGAYLGQFGAAGSGNGQFNNARAVAVDSLGNLYVVDAGNHRVQKFNAAFGYLLQWGTAGSGSGQFNGPQGIAVDPTNTFVYVADFTNSTVQKFTTAGAFVVKWSSANASDVGVDLAGIVYATDFGASHVYRYSSAGSLLATIGSPGTGNGQISGPQGVALDAYGHLFVADGFNTRIVRFTTAGVWQANFVTSGTGLGQVGGVFGVAVDTTGQVYVPDQTGNRIETWGAVPIAMTVTASANNIVYLPFDAASLTVTAMPSGSLGGYTLRDGAASVFHGVLVGGSQVIALNNTNALNNVVLHTGGHSLAATYDQVGGCSGAVSPPLSETILISPTAAALGNNNVNPSGQNQPLVFGGSAVSPLAPTNNLMTGSAQPTLDGVPYGSPLPIEPDGSIGPALVTIIPATAGTHLIGLNYLGNSDFLPSSAPFKSQTVVPSLPTPSFVGEYGSTTGPLGVIAHAEGLALDSHGNLWVADSAGAVIGFQPNGALLRQWSVVNPGGIAIDANDNVLVTNISGNSVSVYSSAGTLLSSWGVFGAGAGQLSSPAAIAVDRAGDVYVEDRGFRLQKFSEAGVFASSPGLPVSPGGQLVCDALGSLYGTNGQTINIYNSATFANQSLVVPSTGSGGLNFALNQQGNGRFVALRAVGVDGLGRLYGSDVGANRVEMLTNTGAFLSQWGLANGRTGFPGAVIANAAGDIYVADLQDHVVQHFIFPQVIRSVVDVGGDQGRQVRLSFTLNALDNATAALPVTSYEVFRQVVPGSAPPSRATPSKAQLAGWDVVGSFPATTDTLYTLVVPTLADSNVSGPHVSTFMVRALTSAPSVSFDSAPDSGYSVDNLPPAVPAPFTAAYHSGATDLHWGANREPDFWYYKLYRGNSPTFLTNATSLIASRSDTGYVDVGPAGAYYKLSAVDVNGNESATALLTPSGTTAVPAAALEFSLRPVRPNPTRGGAFTVEFTLASEAPARLELIDIAGRIVASRDLGAAGIGAHAIAIAPRERLAAGLYLLRLTQGAAARMVRVAVIE